MKNIAKLTSYGCYLDCDFVTAKYPGDETRIVGNVAEYVYDLEQKISDLEAKLAESEIQRKENEVFYKREINRRDTKLRNIKQQLAEKEHELDIRTFEADMNAITITKMRESKHQDKISFCIDKLEEVKELLYPELRFDYSLYLRVMHEIDNQIAELKKGVE